MHNESKLRWGNCVQKTSPNPMISSSSRSRCSCMAVPLKLLLIFICTAFVFSIPEEAAGAAAVPPRDAPPGVVLVNPAKYSQGSVYEQNLNKLLDILVAGATLDVYKHASYGKLPDVAYGASACFNISSDNCRQCLKTNRDTLVRNADYAVGARLYNNGTNNTCFLQYENVDQLVIPPPQPPVQQVLPPDQPPSTKGTKGGPSPWIIVGSVIGAILVSCGCILLYCMSCKKRKKKYLLPLGVQLEGNILNNNETVAGSIEGVIGFQYDDLRVATHGFSKGNKLGQGGFGVVYKGVLQDGTEIAVKQLSLQSNQGKEEFVNEITIITGIQHRNLTRLKGYCIHGDERLLVYEFLENKSLDRVLFGQDPRARLFLDWPTRFNIIQGIAGGLTYLHEESHIQIIHRDIKASNILLDRSLNPKISDFGISKLFDREISFVSTKVAGTFGYLAPEYAFRGRLTVKADVFSFGVLVLEIVSGRKWNDHSLPAEMELLLEWAWNLSDNGRLMEIMDTKLESSYLMEEVSRVLQVALSCTQEEPSSRPSMSAVVAMLRGYLDVGPLPRQRPIFFSNLSTLQSTSYYSASVSSGSSTSGSKLLSQA